MWRIRHGTFLGLGVVTTRCDVMISWVYWYKCDRMTDSVIVWLTVGRVIILRVCLECLFDRVGGGIVCMRVVASSLLDPW